MKTICFFLYFSVLHVVPRQFVLMGCLYFQESCGNYKTDAMGTEGFDYIVIPMATKKTTDGKFVTSNADRFCGQNLAATDMGMAGKTICSKYLHYGVFVMQ